MKNKVSFDFDHTLDNLEVQLYTKQLIERGFDVWITTARCGPDSYTLKLNPNWNDSLYKVCEELNIPRSNIYICEYVDKYEILEGKGFIFHLDDDSLEIEFLEENDIGTIGILYHKNNDWLDVCENILNKLENENSNR